MFKAIGRLLRGKPREFFSKPDQEAILQAVREAEHRTSGEVRIFMESRCRFMDALDRAKEVFFSLKMTETQARNAVLIYIALDDRQLAVYGDEGIHQKTGDEFWNAAVARMIASFRRDARARGVIAMVKEVGEALAEHFPYDAATDRNELPDEIIFGR